MSLNCGTERAALLERNNGTFPLNGESDDS